jgi:hypothetical protein
MKASHLVVSMLLVLGFVLFLAPRTWSADESEQRKEVNFQWAFGAMKETPQGPRFEPITRDTTLKSGDRIKFFVRKKSPCFVYLIFLSSHGEVSVLFPCRFESLDTDYSSPQTHYIPEGDQWFELDEHVGQETFYLLVSAERLYDLETLVNDYQNADRSKKPELADRILPAIRKLRKQHKVFKSHAERPVRIIGNIRGAEKLETAGTPDLADYAVEISANKFFGRTFTIDHQ